MKRVISLKSFGHPMQFNNFITNSILLNTDSLEPNAPVFYRKKSQKPFKLPLARLKPFLIAESRKRMKDAIWKNLDKVVRVYTDSFVLTEDDPSYKKKSTLKIEKKYHGKNIINVKSSWEVQYF